MQEDIDNLEQRLESLDGPSLLRQMEMEELKNKWINKKMDEGKLDELFYKDNDGTNISSVEVSPFQHSRAHPESIQLDPTFGNTQGSEM